MLRPALLLPPPRRPLTPRSGKKSLPFFLGPAIGLSGDYPSGTLTRRFGAARFRTLPRLRALACGCFRTHHAESLPQLSAEYLDTTRAPGSAQRFLASLSIARLYGNLLVREFWGTRALRRVLHCDGANISLSVYVQ